MRVLTILMIGAIGCATLGGCAAPGGEPAEAGTGAAGAGDLPAIRPRARPTESIGAGGPIAVAPTGQLGTTIASLGDPSQPGYWLETPLVQGETAGTVARGDRVVTVTLMPAGGPATGGSRLSLAAMQALGVPLTELVEIRVSAAG